MAEWTYTLWGYQSSSWPRLLCSLLSGGRCREGFFMFWETLWPLILGFGHSGAVQAFVSRESMHRSSGTTGPPRSSGPRAMGWCRRRVPTLHRPRRSRSSSRVPTIWPRRCTPTAPSATGRWVSEKRTAISTACAAEGTLANCARRSSAGPLEPDAAPAQSIWHGGRLLPSAGHVRRDGPDRPPKGRTRPERVPGPV